MAEHIHILRPKDYRHLQLLEVKRRQYESKRERTMILEKLHGLSEREKVEQSDAYAHFFYAQALLSLLLYWGEIDGRNVIHHEVFCEVMNEGNPTVIKPQILDKTLLNLQHYASPVLGISYLLDTLSVS